MAPRKYRMENRKQAVEETRQRIVNATVALHGQQGIIATSWEDIAQEADVALATVYRHFPSLDELVPACGEHVVAIVKPPTLETAREAFRAAQPPADRIKILLSQLFGFYNRGQTFLDVALHEGNQVPSLAAWLAGWEASRKEIVAEAMKPFGVSESNVQMILALTDFRVWRSLTDQNLTKDQAVEMLSALLVQLLPEAPKATPAD